jgi:peptidyl-prolyl cis-trans isomerase A (cyclophilin A)
VGTRQWSGRAVAHYEAYDYGFRALIFRAAFLLVTILPLLAACDLSPAGGGDTTAARGAPAPNVYQVHFETSRGDFVLEAHREWAPLGADRFYDLVSAGFYDGARFFRVIPGELAQFGIPVDPADYRVWAGNPIADDPVLESNLRGYVSFATMGPDTRTTQVFINLADNSHLDGLGFAPFARVISGMDALDPLYADYGENAPLGPGPDQSRIEAEGNAYLEQAFPNLDFIRSARLLPE